MDCSGTYVTQTDNMIYVTDSWTDNRTSSTYPAMPYNSSLMDDNQSWLSLMTTPRSPDNPLNPYTIYIPVIWGVLVAVGAIGNGIVITTMCFHGDRSATSYYIISLASADLAFILIVVPFTTSMFVIPDWMFGNGMCKLTVYMIYVTLQATCLTLTAMTIDRYFAIVHPIKSIHSRTPQMSIMINLGIWFASLCLSIPFLLFFEEVRKYEEREHVYCSENWPSEVWQKGSTVAVVLTTYVVPLAIIIVCYSQILKHLSRRRVRCREDNEQNPANDFQNNQRERYRKKVTKMVAIVVILFAFLWLPIHVFNLCLIYIPEFPKTQLTYIIKFIAHTLSYSNSCVNPFVYAFLGDGFRRAFRKTVASFARHNTVRPFVQSDAWHTASNEGRENRVHARKLGYSSTTGL